MSKRFRVAIVGGGTGGLTLAQSLHHAGVDVAVYERSRVRAERLQGYRVHINPAGSGALHECLPAELWQAFVGSVGTSGGGFGFVTQQLAELLVVEDDLTSGAERDPTRAHHSVSRITLHQVLSAGLDGVLHHGKEFERYERAADGTVTLHFTDATTTTADVLVAADGANSKVCRQYLPDATRIDTGIRTIAGKYPLTEETKRWLPTRLQDGPNNVLPPSAACSSPRMSSVRTTRRLPTVSAATTRPRRTTPYCSTTPAATSCGPTSPPTPGTGTTTPHCPTWTVNDCAI